jgi:hypothetical protein
MKPEHIHADWSEDGEDRLRRIIRSEMNTRREEMGVTYNEVPSWVVKAFAALGLTILGLVATGVVGLVVMYGQVSSLTTSVNDLRREFEQSRAVKSLERGAADAADAH